MTVSRPAPSVRLLGLCVDALIVGAKASDWQPLAWKGLLAADCAPAAEVTSALSVSAAQLVGLTMKEGRWRLIRTPFRRRGMPPRMVGKELLLIVSCALWGFTEIAALTTTVPRL